MVILVIILLGKFVPLSYAQDLFNDIVDSFSRKMENKGDPKEKNKSIEKDLEIDILGFSNEYAKMHPDDKSQEHANSSSAYPIISKECFCMYLQSRLEILFKDTANLSKLLGDLQSENKELINIRELRDQILGYRYSNGNVCTWGIDEEGRLGNTLKKDIGEEERYCPRIVKFDYINGQRPIITKVSCGSSHTLALTNHGKVFGWGLGQKGCLGLGNDTTVLKPAILEKTADNTLFRDIKDIACGASHCLALSMSDILFSWGCGLAGRLGHGNEEHYNMPKVVANSASFHFDKISAGYCHSGAITKDMELYTWGDGAYGKLGHGNFCNEYQPLHVVELTMCRITSISCGVFHTHCISQTGKLYSFGGGAQGKLGLDIVVDGDSLLPKKIITLDEINIVEAVAAPYHSVALADDGKLFTWGSNREGRLGIGSVKEVHMIPEIVPNNVFSHEEKVEGEDANEEENAYKDYDKAMKRIYRPDFTKNLVEVVFVAVIKQIYLMHSVGLILMLCLQTLEKFICAVMQKKEGLECPQTMVRR